ncbi:MAG: hypothetical protein GEV11_22315 [Streptosporangiales bacterium]|nr:hypothetical protein [Streptosporangiales bacterium]
MTPLRTRSRSPSWRRGAAFLAVIAAAAAGCTGTADRAASTSATGGKAAATRITTVDPWTRTGLTRGYTVTGDSAGTCVPSGTSMRSDAFRCFDTDDQVFDPCLAGRYADPVKQVACPVTSREVHLVRPSPAPSRTSNGATPEQDDFWMAVLADGTRCRSSTGAGPPPLEGLDVLMYCRDGTLWGDFDTSTPIWTVRRSRGDTGPLATAQVREVFR